MYFTFLPNGKRNSVNILILDFNYSEYLIGLFFRTYGGVTLDVPHYNLYSKMSKLNKKTDLFNNKVLVIEKL